MTERYDVVVVGSGIVGLGAAYAAARRGQRVLVLDRTAAPIGSTVRNFGHLCFTPQSGEARRYAALARPLWLRLARDAGLWVRESGTVVAARHDDELALLAAAAERVPEVPFGDDPEVRMLDAEQVLRLAPVRHDAIVGGALLPYDLQADPRYAAAQLTAHLQSLGVTFRMRTAVTAVRSGAVETTRGRVEAGTVVVAVNHDLDQLLPELAESVGVTRCGLDMLRLDVPLAAPLAAPLLTGWSLIRYRGFAAMPEADRVRERLHGERPDLAAIDLNQMYTQFPDGTLVVGDSHYRADALEPFQTESAFDALLLESERLFGVRGRVVERWQGVYASGPDEFLTAEPEEGVLVTLATTGIGMTTGLGLAEHSIAARLGAAPALEGA